MRDGRFDPFFRLGSRVISLFQITAVEFNVPDPLKPRETAMLGVVRFSDGNVQTFRGEEADILRRFLEERVEDIAATVAEAAA